MLETINNEMREIFKAPAIPSETPTDIPDELDIEAIYAWSRQMVKHIRNNVEPMQGYILATGKGHYFVPVTEGMLPVKMGQPKNRRGEDLF